MSLASRTSGTNQGSNHTAVASSSTVNQGTNLVPPKIVGSSHAAAKSGRTGGTLTNLLGGRLTVPRSLHVKARDALDNTPVPIDLNFTGTIGQGTFGQIEKATLTYPTSRINYENEKRPPTNEGRNSLSVAVKRVLQDPRYKNRELSIMQRINHHPNIVKFYYYYFSFSSSSSRSRRGQGVCEQVSQDAPVNTDLDVYLQLILECFPGSLCELVYMYSQRMRTIPVIVVKLFTYQMLKALAYLHSLQICHRDMKSSNLLVDESTMTLKLCDFGSAKEMVPGSASVSYISSRYYRAPELLFGAQFYTCAIDSWGAGCVLAEMLRQHCLFMGSDSVDQLVKVIRVLGTPSPEDIASMNPMYETYNFPDVQSCPMKLFFPRQTQTELLAFMSRLLIYNPKRRLTPAEGLQDPCFEVLRIAFATGQLPDGIPFPGHLFDANPTASTYASRLPLPRCCLPDDSLCSGSEARQTLNNSTQATSSKGLLASQLTTDKTRKNKGGSLLSKDGQNPTQMEAQFSNKFSPEDETAMSIEISPSQSGQKANLMGSCDAAPDTTSLLPSVT